MISTRTPCRILSTAAIAVLLFAMSATAATKKGKASEPCPVLPTVTAKDTLLDSLSQRLKALDTQLVQLESAKAGLLRENMQLRDDSVRLGALLVHNTTLVAGLKDSLSRYMAFDSGVVLLDSVTVSDTLLNRWIVPMTRLATTGILHGGKGVRLAPRIAGHRDCPTVRVRMSQRNDSTWFSIDRAGTVFTDSIASTSTGRIERLQRDVARQAFGSEAFPSETKAGTPWPVRAAVLGGATLLAVITMVSLW